MCSAMNEGFCVFCGEEMEWACPFCGASLGVGEVCCFMSPNHPSGVLAVPVRCCRPLPSPPEPWHPLPPRDCFLATLPGAGPCDGRLVRCHLIPRQILRREVWAQREALRPPAEASGRVFPSRLRELCWDTRCWVYGCGGLTGMGGHHGQLDHSRTLRIPRVLLPAGLEEFAMDYGLSWWLDREYGLLGEGGITS